MLFKKQFSQEFSGNKRQAKYNLEIKQDKKKLFIHNGIKYEQKNAHGDSEKHLFMQ